MGVLIPEGIKLTRKLQELKLCGNRAESITLEQIIKVTRRGGRTVVHGGTLGDHLEKILHQPPGQPPRDQRCRHRSRSWELQPESKWDVMLFSN